MSATFPTGDSTSDIIYALLASAAGIILFIRWIQENALAQSKTKTESNLLTVLQTSHKAAIEENKSLRSDMLVLQKEKDDALARLRELEYELEGFKSKIKVLQQLTTRMSKKLDEYKTQAVSKTLGSPSVSSQEPHA